MTDDYRFRASAPLTESWNHFRFEKADGVATVTFSRPEKLNPLTFESYADLRDLLGELPHHQDVRVLVIRGEGKAFCAGGDVNEIIGEPGTGFKTALATLDHTRITIAAQALGLAQGALDYATGYVQEREQFGQRISDFQGVQFMLADMAMKLEAARQLTYHAAIQSEQAMHGVKQPGLTFTSSAAKCYASDVAMDITTDAVQLLGGYGYVKDYPVERMMRDAKITQIYEGTNQIQRMVMARQLLKG